MKKLLGNKLAGLVIVAEYIINASVALTLTIAGMMVFVQTLGQLKSFSSATVFILINNALLMLIIKEVLWTTVKFFKKQPFSLGSFLFIGVISSIREILVLEVKKSMDRIHPEELALELGVYALVILALTVAYYLYTKAQKVNNG